jgi:hypothetical protein
VGSGHDVSLGITEGIDPGQDPGRDPDPSRARTISLGQPAPIGPPVTASAALDLPDRGGSRSGSLVPVPQAFLEELLGKLTMIDSLAARVESLGEVQERMGAMLERMQRKMQ